MKTRPKSDADWAAEQIATLPARWCMSIMREWERRRSSFRPHKLTGEGEARRAANEALRTLVARLLSFAVNDMLPLDAEDDEVQAVAWECAERCRVALLDMMQTQQAGRDALRAAGLSEAQADAAEAMEQRASLTQLCVARGIKGPGKRSQDVGAVRRMVAEKWWVGQMRKAHARAVESAAIELGLVNKNRDCYVSNESLEARGRQNKRNADFLEQTKAINLDTDQEFTMMQLAARGVANKAVRRAELMTRISGFERVAIASKHTGLFLTITCPSKMHRFRMAGGTAKKNTKWDGTLPNEAQKYLTSVWARTRAALARAQAGVYGFRIAEPQHDGTPHWHLLLFYPPESDTKIRATIRRYALQMDGDEAGAQERRVDFKTMDPSIGTAAAYIAKYVAKNIDGYRLEKDLIGNDALETSARVEAWATRWRIRQFQQVGGPPVTVWRELRRVESVPSDAPNFVIAAHDAVNKVAVFEGRENASVAWDHYVKAQGGVFCGRNYRVRLSMVASDKRNAYGEAASPVPVGIEYHEVYKVRDAIGNWIDVKPMTTVVESRRYQWKFARNTAMNGARGATFAREKASGLMRTAASTVADGGFSFHGGEMPDLWLKGKDYDEWAAKNPAAALEWEKGLKRAQRAPRTCVNNCTGAVDEDVCAGGWRDSDARNGNKNGRAVRRHGEHGNAGSRSDGETRSGGTTRTDIDALRARKNDGREVPRAGRAAH
ncbi:MULTISPECIES: replication endonuclease [unclassified Caballeronia]|uniref:replication endonuclease n=1 Tax=unclassified Caballeronia TaxID=2646786 RepID=UPI0020277366|nr:MULTISPECIES: replication endonuclease [unclassified Caballeronia]